MRDDDPEHLLGLSKPPDPATTPPKEGGDKPPASRTERAFGFVAGMICGCMGFFVAGGIITSMFKSFAVSTVYLVVSAIFAIWLATKRDWRGFALGILLPLGLLLLLIGYCATHPVRF